MFALGCQLSLDCTDGMICDLDVWLLQGGAPPSFLMLVVDIVEVDYVHLQSDTRAVWNKQPANCGVGSQHTERSQPVWYKEDVNP